MMDFSAVKKLFIPEGEVKQITNNGIVLWKSGPTNQVSLSINADGTIYNNGLGYKNNYRVRSGGVEAVHGNASCTGFIPVHPNDKIYLSGFDFTVINPSNAINVSDNSFNNLGQLTPNYADGGYGIFAPDGAYFDYSYKSVVKVSDGVWKWIVPPATSSIAYIRVTGHTDANGDRMIVTINEAI